MTFHSLFQATKAADFSSVKSIQTLLSDCEAHRKAVLQLRISGASEPLTITCPCLEEAESMSDLIDGYCRLLSPSHTSLWTRKGSTYFILSLPQCLTTLRVRAQPSSSSHYLSDSLFIPQTQFHSLHFLLSLSPLPRPTDSSSLRIWRPFLPPVKVFGENIAHSWCTF